MEYNYIRTFNEIKATYVPGHIIVSRNYWKKTTKSKI